MTWSPSCASILRAEFEDAAEGWGKEGEERWEEEGWGERGEEGGREGRRERQGGGERGRGGEGEGEKVGGRRWSECEGGEEAGMGASKEALFSQPRKRRSASQYNPTLHCYSPAWACQGKASST